jgi:hypothetical protein
MTIMTTEMLRAKADELGVRYTAKTSDDVLLAKIEEAEKKQVKKDNAKIDTAELMKLKRVTIKPLNPNELHQKTKYFCVMNRYLTLRKAILFDKPIFLEQIMIDHIKGLNYVQVPSNLDNTQPTTETKIVPAYSVIDLPDLTKEELNQLKKDKALRDAANSSGTK